MTVPRGFVRGGTVAVAAADLIGSRAEQEAGGPAATPLAAFSGGDIRIGDVMVDEDHGRAVVVGLAAGPEGSGEAITLRFAGEARRLVPVAEAKRLWRYGSEEEAVTLDRLDGSTLPEAYPGPRRRTSCGPYSRSNDLASGRPMDRLVVGDVGYGKTEIALRAAAQAVFAGH